MGDFSDQLRNGRINVSGEGIYAFWLKIFEGSLVAVYISSDIQRLGGDANMEPLQNCVDRSNMNTLGLWVLTLLGAYAGL